MVCDDVIRLPAPVPKMVILIGYGLESYAFPSGLAGTWLLLSWSFLKADLKTRPKNAAKSNPRRFAKKSPLKKGLNVLGEGVVVYL